MPVVVVVVVLLSGAEEEKVERAGVMSLPPTCCTRPPPSLAARRGVGLTLANWVCTLSSTHGSSFTASSSCLVYAAIPMRGG